LSLMDTLKTYFMVTRLNQVQDEVNRQKESGRPAESPPGSSAKRYEQTYYGPGPYNELQALEFMTPEEREAWVHGRPYPTRTCSIPTVRPVTTPSRTRVSRRGPTGEDVLWVLLWPVLAPLGLGVMVTSIGSLVFLGMEIAKLLPRWFVMGGSEVSVAAGLALLILPCVLIGGLLGWVLGRPFKKAPELVQLLLLILPTLISVPVLITQWGLRVPNLMDMSIPSWSLVGSLPSVVSDLFRVSFVGSYAIAFVSASWGLCIMLMKRMDMV